MEGASRFNASQFYYIPIMDTLLFLALFIANDNKLPYTINSSVSFDSKNIQLNNSLNENQ